MRKVFGRAADFYRVRLVHLEEVVPPELDWREDILFYPPPPYDSQSALQYRLEIVYIDDGHALPIAFLADRQQAEKKYDEIKEDLSDLTKIEFEEKYKISE